MASKPGLDELLSVGLAVSVHPNPNVKTSPRLKAYIRGWSKGKYVLIDQPVVNMRFLPVKQNRPCVVRFIAQGWVCGFDGLVVSSSESIDQPYFKMEWPDKLAVIQVRKDERVGIDVPCTL